jgi:hypothetical protein
MNTAPTQPNNAKKKYQLDDILPFWNFVLHHQLGYGLVGKKTHRR